MRKQAGARFLYRAKHRKEQSFVGLVQIANPKTRIIKLSSGAVKRVRS